MNSQAYPRKTAILHTQTRLTMEPAWKSFQFSKAANLFEILIWYCFLTSSSLSFLRFNLTTSNFCAPCLFTANLSLTFATTTLWSVSQSPPLKDHTSSILDFQLLSVNIQSIWLWVFPSGEVHVYLWMFHCGNIMLFNNQISWCGKVYYTKTPISLLSWCRLSFPTVGVKISSLPNSTLKSPNRIFIVAEENDRKPALILHKNCFLNHCLYPHLVHVHLLKQWSYTTDLSELYTTFYH